MVMDTFQATELLRDSKRWSLDEFTLRESEVTEAFRVFWASSPDEQEFSHVMNHMRLIPAMLYIMVRGAH